MTDHERTRLDAIQAPYGKEIRLDDLRFESGMRLLRMTIREGSRFTTLDLDPERAAQLARAIAAWAETAA